MSKDEPMVIVGLVRFPCRSDYSCLVMQDIRQDRRATWNTVCAEFLVVSFLMVSIFLLF